ncbi:MAG: thioredoxin family protein [Hyphomicrobiales bacterium]|nr:thioredoxin family protein [Hyphomicrobiales bacterium]MDE2018214.1 thioredoxin family protein [Hyphomicrobiales bacterium]
MKAKIATLVAALSIAALPLPAPLAPASARADQVVTPFTETHFTHAAFAAAQAAGKPILVEIFATWCPTCAAQKQVIDPLLKTPEFKDLVVLRVDFDGQKAVVREFGARMQSTLFAFRGHEARGGVVGETDPAALHAFLAKAMAAPTKG